MPEIEELEGGYCRRIKRSPNTESVVDSEHTQGTESALPASDLAEVASSLHGLFGNQLVGAALYGEETIGLEATMAIHLGAAVAGIGAWSAAGMGTNQALCRAMRHAHGGDDNLVAPKNLAHGGSALPDEVRQRMETAMGHDFSHVRVHTDGHAQTASADIHAHAFTAGSHIYFGSGEYQPGTTTGDRLLAHELTHVIQHDEHRLTLPSAERSVSLPTDSTEVEAYANERRVLGALQSVDAALDEGLGETEVQACRTSDEILDLVQDAAAVQAAAAPAAGAAAVHRAVENPSAPADDDPSDDYDKAHRPISVADGHTTGGVDMPTPKASESGASVNWEVKLIATKDDPLRFAGCPTDAMLFEIVVGGEEEEKADECTGKGIPITSVSGSAADPNVEVKPTDQALYIGGGPKADDVSQGGFGDCYFLAALLNVLAHDPERVRGCIQPAGENVTFNFWMSPDQGATWQRTSVTTDRTALQWINTNDASVDYDGLIGAGVRVAPESTTSDHYAEAEGATLTITRADLHEMALWAPLLEKVYARIAEKFNEYAGYKTGSDVNTGATGYDRIEGGWSHWVYPMFYGPDFVSNQFDSSMQVQPGGDNVGLNKTAISQLLQMEGFRAGDGATEDTGEHVMLTASVQNDASAQRLVDLIDHCDALAEMRRYPTLKRVMGQVKTLANNYINASAADEETLMNRLSKGCERQVADGAWPLLESPRANKIWRDLHEALGVVANIGTDASDTNRNIYANHAYPVIAAHFAKEDGSALAVNIDNLDAEIGNISGTASTVTLRNPHHSNEPNLPSSMVDSDSEDGLFNMSLDSYLRAFGRHTIGRVNDTPAPTP